VGQRLTSSISEAGGLLVVSMLAVVVAAAANQPEFPRLEGPYLGQTPPGTSPQTFSPDLISTGAVEACLSFSFDGRFLVFRRGFREDTAIYVMENRNDVWMEPEPAPFFVKEFGFGDFTFSPNSPELYFTSRRPLVRGGAPTEPANLWKVAYEGENWLEPVPLGPTVNSEIHDSYPSVSNDGTLFFFRRFDAENGLSEIMRSEVAGEGYGVPKRMPREINTQWDEWDPCISPDGSFLVFCSKKPSGFGEDDLYVSFKRRDGSWTEAVNLGDQINSDQSENRPFITADGEYLFFNSNVNGNRDVFWVDVEAIRMLKP